MARTKKYLANSVKLRNSRSFYRPIKRLNSQSGVPSASTVNFLAPRQRKVELTDTVIPQKTNPLETIIRPVSDNLDQQQKDSNKGLMGQNAHNDVTDTVISLDADTTNPSNVQTKAATDPLSTQDKQLSEHSTDEAIDYLNHDVTEELEKLELSMQKSHDKDVQISEQLRAMQSQFEKEKEKLQKTIHVLKKEIEHNEPLTENKFFTISKELREITAAMNHLLENDQLERNSQITTQPTVISNGIELKTPNANLSDQVKIISGTSVSQTSNQPVKADIAPTQAVNTPNPTQNQTDNKISDTQNTSQAPAQPVPADKTPTPSEKPTKKRRIPKPIVALISTLLITGLIGGYVWFSFNKKPEISSQLIQEYMPADAKQATTTPLPEEKEKKIKEQKGPSGTPASQVQGASDVKYAESQADVAYSDTLWDSFKDPTIGVELSYPKNTVNPIKTETSLTFLRKSGYLFKVQVYETALDVAEYWKSVKANSLDYKVKETEFRGNPAFFLELEDITEYPGDRYLVKKGDFIYDIWYATYSKNIADEDIKRVEIMLNSFKFLQYE